VCICRSSLNFILPLMFVFIKLWSLTEQVGVVGRLQAWLSEMWGPNFNRDTGYINWWFAWYSSVPPGKYRCGSASIISRSIPSESFPFNSLIIYPSLVNVIGLINHERNLYICTAVSLVTLKYHRKRSYCSVVLLNLYFVLFKGRYWNCDGL
jgi:hypothetical protein